jgi:protein O-mannosyl-transferase
VLECGATFICYYLKSKHKWGFAGKAKKTHMLAKLNKLTNWQAAVTIVLVGFVVFASGLTSPFRGDDDLQIVSNPTVHSLANIKLFFEGGTFYNGQQHVPLTGTYFRPLMTTTFSLIYSVFGAHSFYYHLVQLLLCIGSAVILYLFFRYSFKPAMALFLALVFLVHPLNSQVVFAIPSMQDALFFFFGILGLYLLFKCKSAKSLLLVVLCMLLSLFAKETGIFFVILATLYLFWFNRKRLLPFLGFMLLPAVLWFVLKVHAIGLNSNPNNTPIDSLSLGGRLPTDPSIMLFYLEKFIFPWKLATSYHWVYPTFSVSHVLVPLIIDLTVIAAVVYGAVRIRRKAPEARYYSYVFFTIWAGLGLLAHLQIIPLDMTACETWFYFSMPGVLGMLGVAWRVFPVHIHTKWVLPVLGILLLILLGFRTAARGFDWKNENALLEENITASKEDFSSYNALAQMYMQRRDYTDAEIYVRKSVAIYPSAINDNTLGEILFLEQDYAGAYAAFTDGLKHLTYYGLIDNLAVLTAYYGNTATNRRFLLQAVKSYPQDVHPWFYLALLDYEHNHVDEAKVAITQAYKYGQSYQGVVLVYQRMMSGQPLNVATNGSQ